MCADSPTLECHPVQRAVVVDQEAFHNFELSQGLKFPTTCQDGTEGARWRWRMMVGVVGLMGYMV